MILVAILSAVYWRRRTKIASTFFLLGALAWIAAVVLKGIAALPKDSIIEVFRNLLPAYLSEPLAWIYIGILTGIFECGIILLFLCVFKRLREQIWDEAVGLGLGFGAFEALMLGIGAFVLTLLVILIPEQLPKGLMELMRAPHLDTPLVIPAPIIERISTLFIHIFSTVLIVFSFMTKEWKWFWLSFLYKTVVDSIAGAVYVSYGIGNLTVYTLYTLEAIFAFIAIVGILGLRMLKKKWRERLEVEQVKT